LGALSDGLRAAQQLGNSVLPVVIAVSGGSLTLVGLRQGKPAALVSHEDPTSLAAALGLGLPDIGAGTDRPQVVATGPSHLLVQTTSREAVDRARPNVAALMQELKSVGAQGCYLYCLAPTSPTATAYARFFNPTVGIPEDPTTGSAAGPLAWHLKERGLVSRGADVTVEQGYGLGRPSRLTVRVDGGGVELRGRCITVASGVLRL
jgi:trans-2,3-dihydro-3-hydroxyanthranilate isomerase